MVLLTGRPVRVQPATLAWLERYGLRWDLLIMRNRGDYSTAPEFKRQTVGELRERGFDLRLAFEDDIRNRDMFKSEGGAASTSTPGTTRTDTSGSTRTGPALRGVRTGPSSVESPVGAPSVAEVVPKGCSRRRGTRRGVGTLWGDKEQK